MVYSTGIYDDCYAQHEACASFPQRWQEWSSRSLSSQAIPAIQIAPLYRFIAAMIRITSSTARIARVIFTQLKGCSPAIFPV